MGPSVLIQHAQPMSVRNPSNPCSLVQIGKNIKRLCDQYQIYVSTPKHSIFEIRKILTCDTHTASGSAVTALISVHKADQHLLGLVVAVHMNSEWGLTRPLDHRSQITFHLAHAHCCALEPQTETWYWVCGEWECCPFSQKCPLRWKLLVLLTLTVRKGYS